MQQGLVIWTGRFDCPVRVVLFQNPVGTHFNNENFHLRLFVSSVFGLLYQGVDPAHVSVLDPSVNQLMCAFSSDFFSIRLDWRKHLKINRWVALVSICGAKTYSTVLWPSAWSAISFYAQKQSCYFFLFVKVTIISFCGIDRGLLSLSHTIRIIMSGVG